MKIKILLSLLLGFVLIGCAQKIENKEIQNKNMFVKFINTFPPAKKLEKPTNEILNFYADKLPKEILEFWKKYGFGEYGNGLIRVINPEEYTDILHMWLGIENDFSKLPILMTSFGDIYYYRKLSETEHDISLLNIHYRNIKVCAWDIDEFFNDYITNKDIYSKDLKTKLFKQALQRKGKLSKDQIYFYVPALIMGGIEKINSIDKGNLYIHNDILFQMGQ